jgi:hypothetical protein
MIKLQPISALSCSLTAILVALSPLSVFAGTDDSVKPISPRIDRSIQGDEGTKTIVPNGDDGIKPIVPRIDRSSQGDDAIKPVAPNRKVLSPTSSTIQKSGNVDTGVKPIAPKTGLPARKMTTGQNDDGI